MVDTDQEITGIISGDRHVDHAELASNARRAAGGFELLGVRPDDTIAILLRNDIAFFVATLGAQGAEASPVPINWHSTSEDVRYIIQDCGARILVAHADLLAKLDRDALPDCTILSVPTPPEVAGAYGVPADACAVSASDISWEEWLEKQPERTVPARSGRGNIVYTSGTTGRPKGVMREPIEGDALDRMYEIIDDVFGIPATASVRSVVVSPLYHPAPNFHAMRGLAPGSLLVLQPKFDEMSLLATIERYRITHLSMVPTMFIRLLRLDEDTRGRYDLSSIQRVSYGAAPTPAEVQRDMIAWWGPVFYELYGGTESGIVTMHNSQEALDKPGTVGRPFRNSVIKILDDDGRELPPNEEGEVFCRNFDMPDFTYRGMPDKRAEVQKGDLITVGDIGLLDEDGFLFLRDRKRDMIISGGVNIYPAEIEQALVLMPGVKDCAVFGIPDGEFGEAVCAHVELLDGSDLTPEQISAWLRAKLGGWRTPKLVKIDTGLPREDSGKIMKKNIRARYWADMARRI